MSAGPPYPGAPPRPASPWAHAGPYGLLALGLLLRWVLVPDARFTGDEALFYRTAQDIVTLGDWPVLGPPVSGTEARHPGAGFYYLMALPALLGRSPLWSGMFVSLLSVAALTLLVRMARQTRGEAAAWVAGALGATSPWLILYADRIWNSNVAPWIALVILYGLWRMRQVPRSRWVAAVAFGLMALFQFHLSAPILWVAAAALLLCWRPRVHWGALAVGVALGVLWYTPYLVHELTHDFANTRAILSRGTGGNEDAAQVGPALLYLGLFGTGELGYHVHTGYWRPYDPTWQLLTAAGWRDSLATVGPLRLAGVALSLLVAALGLGAGLLRLGADAWRRRAPADPMALALVAGGATGVALLVASAKPVYPHYVNLLLAPAFFLAADGVRLIAAWVAPRPRAAVTLGITAALVLTFATGAIAYYREVDAPVGAATSLAAVETIAEASGGRPFALRFHTFPNHFAYAVLASHAARVPWPVRRAADQRFDVHPRAGGEAPPPALSGAARLWRAGDVWIVHRPAN